MGYYLGEMDSDGIAEWYPNCKVRFDGSHYIATPYTTNPTKRTKRKEEKITVSFNGKYELVDKPKNECVRGKSITNKEVAEAKDKSPPDRADEPKTNVWQMTRRQIFDNLYNQYLSLKPKERKQAVYEDMQQYKC